MSPATPVPVLLLETRAPFWSATELALIDMLPPAPVPSAVVRMPLPEPSIMTELDGLARPCTVILPAAPAPVDDAVMVPPDERLTVFAFTKIEPPVAVGTVPEVLAESAPPFAILTEF